MTMTKKLFPTPNITEIKKVAKSSYNYVFEYMEFVARFPTKSIARCKLEITFKKNMNKYEIDFLPVSKNPYVLVVCTYNTYKWNKQARGKV